MAERPMSRGYEARGSLRRLLRRAYRRALWRSPIVIHLTDPTPPPTPATQPFECTPRLARARTIIPERWKAEFDEF